MSTYKTACAAFFFYFFTALPAFGNTLAGCTAITEDDLRLACYDSMVAESKVASPVEATTLEQTEVPAEAEVAVETEAPAKTQFADHLALQEETAGRLAHYPTSAQLHIVCHLQQQH